MSRFVFVVGIAALMSVTTAMGQQPPDGKQLKVSNPTNKDVWMWYGPRDQRGKAEMRKKRIPARQTIDVPLNGTDPWDVQCYRTSDATFQAQISVTTGVNLNERADQGEIYELNLTYAEQGQGRQKRYQIMSARLLGSASQNEDALFADAGEISDFADGVLQNNWRTQFTSGNNQNVSADVRLGEFEFETRQFVGKFHHLAVYEDDSAVVVVAQWSASNPDQKLGDVYFTVRKDRPDTLDGFYTFDSRPGKRFPWRSR